MINKALQVNPNLRISSAEFISHPWFAKHGLIQPIEVHDNPIIENFVGIPVARPDIAIGSNREIKNHAFNRSASREVNHVVDHQIKSPPKNNVMTQNLMQNQFQRQPGLMASTTVPNFFMYKEQPLGMNSPNMSSGGSPVLQNRHHLNGLTTTLQHTSSRPILDYIIVKDTSVNSESKNNTSTDILSNDVSRIRATPGLRLRSNSRSGVEPGYTVEVPPAAEYQTPTQVNPYLINANSFKTTDQLSSFTNHFTPRSDQRLLSGNKQAGTGGHLDTNYGPQSSSRHRENSPLNRPLFTTPLNHTNGTQISNLIRAESPQSKNLVNDPIITSMVQPQPMMVHRNGPPTSLAPISIRSTPPPNSLATILANQNSYQALSAAPANLNQQSMKHLPQASNSNPPTESYRPLLSVNKGSERKLFTDPDKLA